jgi:hypothetical protein
VKTYYKTIFYAQTVTRQEETLLFFKQDEDLSMDTAETEQGSQQADIQSGHDGPSDGCDVVLSDEDATADADLPASEGGVA